jgi:putative ABC transport system permease protein
MFVLALANVTSLLIAQSNFRRREISIRSALGAGTARLGRQLVAECVVFVAVAGLASLVVGYWTLRGIIFWMPEQWVPLLAATQLDVRSAAFALVLTLAAGVFGGLMIAHRFSTATLFDDLKGNRQTSGRREGLRSAFTVIEIALAVVLIVGAVVMTQSVRRLLSVDPGFRTAQLVSMNLSLPQAQYKEPADVIRFYRDLRESVARMPGVESAAVIDEQPLTTSGGTMHVLVYGQAPPEPGHEPESVIRSASPHYFETMGIRLIRGRTFADTDSASTRNVVILSEMLADRLFGTADPVGQRIVFPFDNSMWDIVGVVGDVHLSGLDLGMLPTLYTCSLQDPSTSSVLMVRTGMDPASLAATVRGEVNRMNAELPVYGFRSMDRTIDNTAGVSTRKLVLYLVTAFSGIGALMAGIGLYSLLTFVVAQRSKEIGIRMALGARGATIGKMVLRQVLSMTGIGLAVGTIAAVGGTRLIQAVLFGVSPSSPSTLLIVALLTAVVAGAACCVPVVRAARMDPNTVLRND